jgi:gliding motility-associated-like protein
LEFIATNKSVSLKAQTGDVRLAASYQFGDAKCHSADTFVVVLKPTPELAFQIEDTIIYIPKTGSDYLLAIDAKHSAPFDYKWESFPPRYIDDNLLTFPEPQPFSALLARPTDRNYYLLKLTITGEEGCAVSDSLYVATSFEFFIPNAFTPNGDGNHDEWKFFPLEHYTPFYTISVLIFNRAGILVYESKEYHNTFDGRSAGKDLPMGAYYYVVKLIDKNHIEADQSFTGSVTIIR